MRTPANIPVSMKYGHTRSVRTPVPWVRISARKDSVKPTAANLLAEYAVWRDTPMSPAALAIVTTVPCRRSTIPGRTSMRITPAKVSTPRVNSVRDTSLAVCNLRDATMCHSACRISAARIVSGRFVNSGVRNRSVSTALKEFRAGCAV